MKKETINNDAQLLNFLQSRNYGGDRSKISLSKNNLDLKDIRNTIKENRL